MPNPRTRHSKRRTRARRTHDHAAMPQLAVCKNTGAVHMYHNAYTHEGSLYYKGQKVVQGAVPVAVDDDTDAAE
jgi:large subunit ribosomal protein L32